MKQHLKSAFDTSVTSAKNYLAKLRPTADKLKAQTAEIMRHSKKESLAVLGLTVMMVGVMIAPVAAKQQPTATATPVAPIAEIATVPEATTPTEAAKPVEVAKVETPKPAPASAKKPVAPAVKSVAKPAAPAKKAAAAPKTTSSGKVVRTMRVSSTAYNSLPNQTDSTPFIAASGKRVHDGMVAANFLPFGTKIRIPEIYGDKVFVVEDRMNKRYKSRVDIWMASYDDAIKYGVRNITIEVLE